MTLNTHLLLIRHGQTEWNRDFRIQGNGDSPLTALGHAQAAAAAKMLGRFNVDALYVSDAGRARQTVAPIAMTVGLEPQVDPRLRERHYGIFEGKTREENRVAHPDVFEIYRQAPPDFAVPGGESMTQLQTRGIAACAEIAERHAGKHVAIVSHGGTIRAIARYVMEMPLMANWRVSVDNGSLTIIRYSVDNVDPWWLVTLNEVAHLSDLVDGTSQPG